MWPNLRLSFISFDHSCSTPGNLPLRKSARRASTYDPSILVDGQTKEQDRTGVQLGLVGRDEPLDLPAKSADQRRREACHEAQSERQQWRTAKDRCHNAGNDTARGGGLAGLLALPEKEHHKGEEQSHKKRHQSGNNSELPIEELKGNKTHSTAGKGGRQSHQIYNQEQAGTTDSKGSIRSCAKDQSARSGKAVHIDGFSSIVQIQRFGQWQSPARHRKRQLDRLR